MCSSQRHGLRKVIPSRLVPICGTKKVVLKPTQILVCIKKKAIFSTVAFKIYATMMWGEYNTSKNRQNVDLPEFRLKTWLWATAPLYFLLVDKHFSMHQLIGFSAV